MLHFRIISIIDNRIRINWLLIDQSYFHSARQLEVNKAFTVAVGHHTAPAAVAATWSGVVMAPTAVVYGKTKWWQGQTIIKRAPLVLPTGQCQTLDHPGCLDHHVEGMPACPLPWSTMSSRKQRLVWVVDWSSCLVKALSCPTLITRHGNSTGA